MEDFVKTYKLEELKDMLFVEFIELESRLNKSIESLMSEEEQGIVRQAQSLELSPYAYASNPDDFVYSRETEARLKRENDYKISVKARQIRMKVYCQLPTNMKASLHTFIRARLRS